MSDFFVYRSCEVGSAARRAIQRNADILNRGIALLQSPSGLPTDSQPPADVLVPNIEVSSIDWDVRDGNGTLPPGTYEYNLIPFDTCTGRTGVPINAPPLVIESLGQVGRLKAIIASTPEDCDALLIQRDGIVVGPPRPLKGTTLDNYPVTVPNPTIGQYVAATANTFTRATGADVQVGDSFTLETVTGTSQVITSTDVVGNLVTFEPPFTPEVKLFDGFFDQGSRTGFYFTNPLNPIGIIGGLPFPQPLNGFKIIKPPGPLPPIPGVYTPQVGDLIVYGSKTALVVGVEDDFTAPGTANVGVIPFGLLPVPPLPAGLTFLVFRLSGSFTPNLGLYQSLDFDQQVGINEIIPPAWNFATPYNLGAIVVQGGQNYRAIVAHMNQAPPNVAFWEETIDTWDQNEPYAEDDAVTHLGVRWRAISNASIGQVPQEPALMTNPSLFPWTYLSNGFEKFEEVANLNPLVAGDIIGINGQLVEVVSTRRGQKLDGDPDVLINTVRFTFTTPLGSPVDTQGFADINQVQLPLGLQAGVFATVPAILADLFAKQPDVLPAGRFTRLTRLTTTTVQNSLWQFQEDGTEQLRSGELPASAAEAKQTLNDMFTKNSYPGGLDGFLDRLRGPSLTETNKTFNLTIGQLVIPTGARQAFAVNELARSGVLDPIDVARIRSLRASIGNLATLRSSASQTVKVLKYKEKLTTVQEKCPPGQPQQVTSELILIGEATRQSPVGATDTIKVIWANGGRTSPNARQGLIQLGLTQQEAIAAIDLQAVNRVFEVVELSIQDSQQIDSLGDVPDIVVGEILDDDRIWLANPGRITREQLNAVLRRRGVGGIHQRPVGTVSRGGTQTSQPPLVEDWNPIAILLAGKILPLYLNFDLCDVDRALASIKDPAARASVAAVFATVEGSLQLMVTVGKAINSFFESPTYQAIKDAISAIVAATFADPTLGCLIGPIESQQFSLPLLNNIFSTAQPPLLTRFQFMGYLGAALESVLCAVLGQLLTLLSDSEQADVQRAIDCLPSLEDVTSGLGINFSTIDLQIALECSFEELTMLSDLIAALTSEVNEILDFINTFGNGFVFRRMTARNRLCSSDQAMADVFNQAQRAMGLLGQIEQTANSLLVPVQ